MWRGSCSRTERPRVPAKIVRGPALQRFHWLLCVALLSMVSTGTAFAETFCAMTANLEEPEEVGSISLKTRRSPRRRCELALRGHIAMKSLRYS